jgi:hypothetical protein
VTRTRCTGDWSGFPTRKRITFSGGAKFFGIIKRLQVIWDLCEYTLVEIVDELTRTFSTNVISTSSIISIWDGRPYIVKTTNDRIARSNIRFGGSSFWLATISKIGILRTSVLDTIGCRWAATTSVITESGCGVTSKDFTSYRVGFSGTSFTIRDSTTCRSYGRGNSVGLSTDWGGSTIGNSNARGTSTTGITETTARATEVCFLSKTTDSLRDFTSRSFGSQVFTEISLIQVERIPISNQGKKIGLRGNGFPRNGNDEKFMKTIGINWKSLDVVIDLLWVVDIGIKSAGNQNNDFLRVGSQSR